MIAHITKDKNGTPVVQSLKEHSAAAAEYASGICIPRLRKASYFGGIIHDLGKAKEEYDEYIQAVYEFPEKAKELRGTVNHTFAAVIWILEHGDFDDPCERIAKEILAFCVGAHHGLFDLLDINGKFGLQHRLEYDKSQIHYEEAVQNFYHEVIAEHELLKLYDDAIHEVAEFIQQLIEDNRGSLEYVYFDISVLCRLLLSAIVYGDHRDTAEFMLQSKEPDMPAREWDDACDFIEEKISQFAATKPIDIVRGNISKQCYAAATRKPGIYQLDVPTGGGKTISGLRYGVRHAQIYEKKRIIYASSHLTIIKQNADVWRKYFYNPEHILESHSSVVNENSRLGGDNISIGELLAESWDTSVIMTTFVQILNALFSGKMTAIGRMSALCNSVIILDEVQNLPAKFTYMFNRTVNFLKNYCNCTVVMCSATQPCFDDVKVPLHYEEEPALVSLSEQQKSVFVRTEIIDKTSPSGMSFQDLASFCSDIIETSSSLLAICNTRNQAKALYDIVANTAAANVMHISNNMCKEHVNAVLEQAINCLHELIAGRSSEKLLLVSTQIPEAGVEISFENTVRALAGLDNIIQSDGRCNRSNEYNLGHTYIINFNQNAEKSQYLPDIYAKQSAMYAVLRNEQYAHDLRAQGTIDYYYSCFFQNVKNELGFRHGETTLFQLLNNERTIPNDEYDLCIPFQEVSESCEVIEGDTFNIIVPYGKHIGQYKALKSTLEKHPDNIGLIHRLLKELKHNVVSVYENQMQNLIDSGHVHSYMDGTICLLDANVYSDKTGIMQDAIASEALFI